MDKHRKLPEFIRFALVGIFATALHYGIYYILQLKLDVNVSYTVGYAISLVSNFYLTSYFTFRRRPSWRKALGFAGAHIFNYLLHLALFNIFLFMGIDKSLAPIPVFSIAIPVNFLLVRYVFKKR